MQTFTDCWKLLLTISSILTFQCLLSTNGLMKSDLFLQSTHLQGDPPGFLDDFDDPTSMRTSGAFKVLLGRYTHMLERKDKGSSNPSDAALPVTGRFFGWKKKVSQVKTVTTVIQAFQKNFRNVIEGATKLIKGSKSEEYTQNWDKCQSEMDLCTKMPEMHIKCGVHCLGKDHPIISALPDMIPGLVEKFCQPKNTILDKIFEYKGKGFAQFRRFNLFMKVLKTAKKGSSDVAKQTLDALLPLIISNVPTDMMPFRKVGTDLDPALTAAESNFHTPESYLTNRLCLTVDDRSAMLNVVDILFKDPTLTDVLLGGLSTMTLISKYVPGNFQLPFASTLEAIRITVGRSCGLIYSGLAGNAAKCDEFGGYPTSGIPLPNLPGIPKKAECIVSEVANWLNLDFGEKDDSDPSLREKRAPQDLSKSFAESAPALLERGGSGDSKSAAEPGPGEMKSDRKKRQSLVVGEKNRKQ